MMRCPEPLNGTCTMSMRASDLNNSPDRCGFVPMPAEPNVRLPGFALASAISSTTVLAGTDGCSIRMLHAETDREIAQCVVRQLRIHARVDRKCRQPHQQCVAVRCAFRDRIVADDGSRAGAILDHELLSQLFAQFLPQYTSDDVSAAAGRRRNNQF